MVYFQSKDPFGDVFSNEKSARNPRETNGFTLGSAAYSLDPVARLSVGSDDAAPIEAFRALQLQPKVGGLPYSAQSGSPPSPFTLGPRETPLEVPSVNRNMMTRSISSPANFRSSAAPHGHSRATLAPALQFSVPNADRPDIPAQPWNPKERQRIPEHNRVVPERILAGESIED